jgi:hypothetical protein
LPFSFLRVETWAILKKKNDRSFDLCEDSLASKAFFPENRHALLGTYEEVSCSEWSGSDGDTLWNGSCLADESAGFWPETACPNTGANHPLACVVMQFWLIYVPGTPPA